MKRSSVRKYVFIGLSGLVFSMGPLQTVQASEEHMKEDNAAKKEMIRIYSVEEDGYVQVPKIEKSEKEWKEQLSEQAYHITREEGTERPGG